ncbi:MAG: TlpA family protein disulfide reductase [Prevotellaceae bacterium]|jgi:peroxiredoxin|nr:TlpA family protein disulfide reductase [Prevotellaceae bacterium]
MTKNHSGFKKYFRFSVLNSLSVYVLSLLILQLFASCGNKAVIAGNVANGENELLELALNVEPKRVIDTVRLKSAGNFSFKYDFKKNTAPVFLTLSAANKSLASLLVVSGEKVRVETDLNKPAEYKVSGSEGSQLLKELNDNMLKVTISVDSLVNLLEKSQNTPEYEELSQKTNKEVAALFTKYKRELIRFIVKNNKSYAAYTAIYQTLPSGIGVFGKEQDALYFKLLADSLETKYPRSPYVYKLRDDYKKLISTTSMQKLLETAEATSIPEIKLPDVTGRDVSLTALKGKLVLLDFWSSKERVTGMNNIELLPIYEKYHPEGFEIYQVSLDENRESWLQAINTQKLPWINVCDFKGVKTYPLQLYNITKLPANYLISKDGEIIGKDLFGEKLDEKIKESLK